jgi:hypothetical protein
MKPYDATSEHQPLKRTANAVGHPRPREGATAKKKRKLEQKGGK